MSLEDVWVPELEFMARFRGRFVVESDAGQTLLDQRHDPLWTEFTEDEVTGVLSRHPGAEMWTEHIVGDGSTFYSRGLARVNRSGAFVFVRKQ